MKVLVTGGCGYIGSVLVPKLLSKGHNVTVIDRCFFGNRLSDHPNLCLIKHDVRDISEIEDKFIGIDAVIDLVAIANDPASEKFVKETIDINYRSRVETAKLAKKHDVKRYILPSSCSVYGFNKGICDENVDTNPISTYADANRKAEIEITNLVDGIFCPVVMRQGTIFGYSPKMRFDIAVNSMAYNAWHDGVVILFGSGDQYRPMLHIDDSTNFMCHLLDPHIFNIAPYPKIVNVANRNYKMIEVAYEVVAITRELLKQDIRLVQLGDNDHRSYRVNTNLSKDYFNFKYSYTIRDSVIELIKRLQSQDIDRDNKTLTLNRYTELEYMKNEIVGCLADGDILIRE